MKKILPLLLSLLLFAPHLHAQRTGYRTKDYLFLRNQLSLMGDGSLIFYYYDVDATTHEIGTELRSMNYSDNCYLNAGEDDTGNLILNKVERMEYHPNDIRDYIIVEFDDSEVTDYFLNNSSNWNAVKVGATVVNKMGLKIQPGTKITVRTRYGGQFSEFCFGLPGSSNTYGSVTSITYTDVECPNGGYNSSQHRTLETTDQNVNGKCLRVYANNTYGYYDWYTATFRYNPTTGVEMTYPLETVLMAASWLPGTPPVPKDPEVTLKPTYGYEQDGIIHYSAMLGMTAELNADESLDGVTVRYILSETPEMFNIYNIRELKPGESVEITDAAYKYLTYAAYYPEADTYSTPVTKRLSKVDARVFANLAAPVDAENSSQGVSATASVNNRPVVFSCPLLVEGIENTADNAKFLYVRDPEGNAMKFVNNGTEYFNETNHYKPGDVIPPYGLTGLYSHSEGWPQINVYVGAGTDFRPYCADATTGDDHTFGEYDARRTTLSDSDFNRHVVIGGLTWTGENSMFTDSEGNPVYSYGRFTSHTGILGGLTAGRSYTVEGFAGQRRGVITLFPTAITPLPSTPALHAPNPITATAEDLVNGYITVNIISDEITLSIGNAEEGVEYTVKYNDGAETNLSSTEFELDNSAFVNGELMLTVTSYLDGAACLKPAKVKFVKHDAEPLASIKAFKELYLDDDAEIANKWHRLSGNIQVRAITPEYIYVRDLGCPAGEESSHSLLIHNRNGWQNEFASTDGNNGLRQLKPGDVITNIALIPAKTDMGNLISENTGYARTVRRVNLADGNPEMSEPKRVDASDPKFAGFGEKDRMVRFFVENVYISRVENNSVAANDIDHWVYTLEMPGNPKLNFHVFSVLQGWSTAYSGSVPYTIEGIVIRDKATDSYDIAFYNFTVAEQTPALALPAIDGVEDTNPTLPQEFLTTATVTLRLAEGNDPDVTIYYTLDGSNPLHNIEGRIVYTAPIELTSSAVIKAYAAKAGAMPSAVVERSFLNNVQERQYIVNFLNQGEEAPVYNFTGTVAVAAIGNEYMFVRGSLGHYLPVKLTAKGASWTDKGYKTGDHLTGFLLRYHVEGTQDAANRMGKVDNAELFATWGTPASAAGTDEIKVDEPEQVEAITNLNIRRMVTVRGATVSAAENGGWTMTEFNGEGASYRLNTTVFGIDMSDAGSQTSGVCDITGFVMYGPDGGMELWPVSIVRLNPAAAVTVTIDGKAHSGETHDFSSTAKLDFACSTPGAVIRYQFYDENKESKPAKWFTYENRPIIVDESCRLHVYATADGYADGSHTHINLTRLDQAAAPAISEASGVVTITAEQGAAITWWTSADATKHTYNAPFTIGETAIVYATASVAGKAESPVAHLLVVVSNEEPIIPADKISGKVTFTLDDTSDPTKVTVYLAPEQGLTGTIYYLINPTGEVTPDNGLVYKNPIEMTEGGRIVAILVESGKYAGEPTDIAVWLIPTDINGIDSEEREDEIRAEGSDIIAPEGSEVFDITGRRVSTTGLRAGIYIVRTPGGKAVKVKVD
ncbi:MAG: hypothetical protein HFJ94_10515 [Muribaculaceae bacterium]|nr:hypothetical protein [Muribaculaceae bacterium]